MRELALLGTTLVMLTPSCRGEPESTVEPPAADTADPCSATALGLGAAAPLSPWKPPTGCTSRSSGTGLVRSDAELAARIACAAGSSAGVDFTKTALLATTYTLSPAGVGLSAFDDGKVVTLVSRQRNSCPGEPMPMPMSMTAWFSLPAGGERSFANSVCTVPTKCP